VNSGFKFIPFTKTRFAKFQFSEKLKVNPLAFQSLRVKPKKYFKSAEDSQNETNPKSWNKLSISDLAYLLAILMTVCQGLNLFCSEFHPLAVTDGGMFAPHV